MVDFEIFLVELEASSPMLKSDLKEFEARVLWPALLVLYGS